MKEVLDNIVQEIIKWILIKFAERMWIGLAWLRIKPMAGFCEHGYEALGCTKYESFLTTLATVGFLRSNLLRQLHCFRASAMYSLIIWSRKRTNIGAKRP